MGDFSLGEVVVEVNPPRAKTEPLEKSHPVGGSPPRRGEGYGGEAVAQPGPKPQGGKGRVVPLPAADLGRNPNQQRNTSEDRPASPSPRAGRSQMQGPPGEERDQNGGHDNPQNDPRLTSPGGQCQPGNEAHPPQGEGDFQKCPVHMHLRHGGDFSPQRQIHKKLLSTAPNMLVWAAYETSAKQGLARSFYIVEEKTHRERIYFC